MPPDLNSLPLSRPSSTPSSPPSHHERRTSIPAAADARPSLPSPRSPSFSSLQATAAINAGLHRSPSRAADSPGSERRRSSLINNATNINDPTLPVPGELQTSAGTAAQSPRASRRSFALPTADPHHGRQPSLGELHQELENEQEAQVNRLLHMIRLQQDQLASIQRQQQNSIPTSTEQTHSPAPPYALATLTGLPNPAPTSTGSSPALHPQALNPGHPTEDILLGGARDEGAIYQAETQMLTRENQMLRLRIRELERQITEMGGGAAAPLTASQPAQQSTLSSPPATFTSIAAPPVPAEVEATKVD